MLEFISFIAYSVSLAQTPHLPEEANMIQFSARTRPPLQSDIQM